MATDESLCNGVCLEIPSRHITKGICTFYNYQISTYGGEQCHVENFYDDDGISIITQRLRFPGKKFRYLGDMNKYNLMGKHLFAPNKNKDIIIVEGAIDSMSVWQNVHPRDKHCVVSLSCKIEDAKDCVAEHLEYLNGFGNLILGFDIDDEGKEATKQVAGLFEPGYVKIIKWRAKDPSEILKNKEAFRIMECIEDSQPHKPEQIVCMADNTEDALKPDTFGYPWPWQEMTNCTLGMLEQQLIVVAGAEGIGKTAMVNQMISHVAGNLGLKVGVFSFEMTHKQLSKRLIRNMSNLPVGESYKLHEVDPEIVEKAGNVFTYDSNGAIDIDSLLLNARYFTKALGAKLVVVDNLTGIAALMDGDERRGIDRAMNLLVTMKRELNCCVILVCHVSRDKDKDIIPWGQGREPELENLRGSGSIGILADVVLGLSRNTVSEFPAVKKKLIVRCLKTRYDNPETLENLRGHKFELEYDQELGKYHEDY